jgi:tight adherence protein B
MELVFEYLLCASGFIAVLLAVEGLWRFIRGQIGEERTIKRRLAKARETAAARSAAETKAAPGPVARLVSARLPGLENALARAQAPVNALQLLAAGLLLFMLVLSGLILIGAPRMIAFAAALALGAGVPYLVVTGLVARRRRRFLEQLPQAVDIMARGLQAGHPVMSAMTVVGERMPEPLGPEFQLVVEEMTYGLDRDQALGNLVRRFPLSELRMFTASLEVTRETGGNLAEVFLKLGDAIRAKDQLRKKVHAISAEGRMTFWVVSALPLVVGGLLMLIRPVFFLDVAKDPLFWPMLSFAPVSLATGSAIIWKMINIKI